MSMATIGELTAMARGEASHAEQTRINGVGTDTRNNLDGQLFVAIRGARFDGHDHLEAAVKAGASAVLVERGTNVSREVPAIVVPDTVAALGLMAAAWRTSMRQLKVVAITGTAGKTTTKDTLADICARARSTTRSPRSFNNSIGVPLTILATRASDEVLVAEVGTSSPGEIAPLAAMLQPDVAVVTLVGEGHLAGLGTLEAVAAEKYELVNAVATGGHAIVHASSLPAPACAGHLETYGDTDRADHPIEDRGPGWMMFEGRRWQLGLPGAHGALNSVAALLAARCIGIDDQSIAAGLEAATPSAHRMSRCTVNGVSIIDDTWNANPESMSAVLRTLPEMQPYPGRLIVVIGDMLELGERSVAHHAALAAVFADIGSIIELDEVILVGPEMQALRVVLPEILIGVEVSSEPRPDEQAMLRIASRLARGDTVLFKGSRGIGLERVIECLESGASAGE
ncbi:MAG: UDP-N-acetylmuramoyl-tripeptide--D-alanyl-D-alanine ligase [Phycisphaerae bacterium]|nr:UDP-N-acetylmuramoyl-tripeptide--D-alanyl-D-alanine ligase [Phycisphaerae bacterium]